MDIIGSLTFSPALIAVASLLLLAIAGGLVAIVRIGSCAR